MTYQNNDNKFHLHLLWLHGCQQAIVLKNVSLSVDTNNRAVPGVYLFCHILESSVVGLKSKVEDKQRQSERGRASRCARLRARFPLCILLLLK